MRIILVNWEAALSKISTLADLPTAANATVAHLDKIAYSSKALDCVVAYVDDLSSLSDAFSMLELLINNQVATLIILSEWDLTTPMSLSDRWERLRIEELEQEKRLHTITVGDSGWEARASEVLRKNGRLDRSW